MSETTIRQAMILEKGKQIQRTVQRIDLECGDNNALFREKILKYFNIQGLPIQPDILDVIARERNSGSYLDAMADSRDAGR
ncbi:MAG: hypothetical protein PHU23_03190 [Dehalococcoidales bacterium]|nr:hypothetical protein [Dehalococcoidales bacterium]